MMSLLIAGIIALFLSVGIALVLKQDPGYALLSIDQWTIETSVAVLIIFLIVVFILLYLLIRFLIRLLQAPRQTRAANQRRLQRRSQSLLTKGIKDLAEGHWKIAEIAFMKGVEYSRTPTLHYIGAARAARRLGVDWRWENYLRKAETLSEKDTLVVKLTRAELLLEKGQTGEAKTVLELLHNRHPHHPRTLELLARCYRELEDWKKLKGILPDLGNSATLDENHYTQLQLEVYRALLSNEAHSGTLNDLHTLWGEIPASLRSDESLLIDYAGHLRDHDATSEAETLLRDALKRQWSDKLIVGYGELGRGNISGQLATAEDWLQAHGKNPYLLLTCGRLAKRSRQLDKARQYLEQSIAIQPSPDAYQELGEVLEELGDKDSALQCYRTGLRLMSGRPEEKEGIAVLPSTREGTEGAASETALMEEDREHTLTAEDTRKQALAKKAQ